jgi:hypothetical protein
MYVPTRAPAFFFDVFSDCGDRIGIASLILEPSQVAVQNCGHVCANLSEKHATVDLLAQVVDILNSYAMQSGLKEVLIVVPAAHALSVDACAKLEPIVSKKTKTADGIEAISYLYASTTSS